MRILLLILFPFFGMAQLPNPNLYTWTQKTANIGYNRDGVEGVYLKGLHLLYGGWSAGTETFNNQFRSVDAINFIATPAAGWWPAHAFATALANNCIYKVHGDPFNPTNNGDYDRSSWRTSDTNWVQLTEDNGLGDRWGGQLVYHESNFFYFGGQTNLTVSGGVYSEAWRSTDSTRHFTLNGSTPFRGGLLKGSIISFKNRLIKIGGTTYDNDLALRIYPREIFIGKKVADTIQWHLAGYMPIKMLSRHYQSLIEYDGLLWLICGYNNWRGNNILDIWCSDDGLNWVQQTPSEMEARHAQACWIAPDGLHVGCGTTNIGGGTTTSDGWLMSKP